MSGSPASLRDFASRVVLATTLEKKLAPPPPDLPDDDPGPPLRVEAPGRPAHLRIVASSDARVPSIEGMADPPQRVRILHAFANHEFQAVELFAWALLAFPEAPQDFRAGLRRILAEEQRHVRLYLDRLAAHGAAFGDHPVSGYFWGKTPALTSPLRFVCAMSLTFEAANLDHADAYRANLTWPLRPALSRGEPFRAEPRRAAGLDEDFLERVRTAGLDET
jgi:hypothetical protein